MVVILPILCFAIFVVIYATHYDGHGALTRWRMSFLAAAVTWGVAVTAITEVLSLFHSLTFQWIVTFWFGLLLFSAIICRAASTREKLLSLFNFPHIARFELWCLGGVVSIAGIVGLVAFIAPPNNADSMFYHMARVMHWVQNQAVAHYPTNILHQLFLPPWSGFAIMHLYILSGSDQWVNFVQWFSLIGSIIGVSLIAKHLGADIGGQTLATVLVATIPMGILQGSSTQNDFVTAFWLVSLLHFILRFKNEPNFPNALWVGATLALALLTKPTAYPYAIPLMVWFTFLAQASLGWKTWKLWQTLLSVAVIVLSINLGHYARNFDLWGNPLGIDQQDPHPNRAIDTHVIVSNAIRNISIHLGTSNPEVNKAIRRAIEFLHNFLGIDTHDPQTTYGGVFSQNWLSHQEDRAGNPIHLMLIILSIALLLISSNQSNSQHLIVYAILLISAFLIYCASIKWSIRHSRAHLPLFVLWSPFISSLLLKQRNRIGVFLIAIIVVVSSALYMSGYATVLMMVLLVLSLCFKWQIWSQPNHAIRFLVAGLLFASSTLYVFRNQDHPLIAIKDSRNILNTKRIDHTSCSNRTTVIARLIITLHVT